MIKIEKRPFWKVKLDNLKRIFMWHFLQKRLGLILVSEFPKSGGTWFCQMLSDATKLPFQRNVNAKFIPSILHWHLLFHPRMNKMIYVIRDGRDVMISAYYHFLFEEDANNQLADITKYHRSHLNFEDYDDIKTNLPAFITHLFTTFARKNFTHFSWSEGVTNSFVNRENVLIIKYEDLLVSPIESLRESLNFYGINNNLNETDFAEIVDKYSFKNLTKRKQGQEDKSSFVRKGISGDWKNYFTEESSKVFKLYGGKALIEAGYEKDLNW